MKKEIRIFLASPSDVCDERETVKNIIDEINLTNGDEEPFVLKLINWESCTYPSVGEYSQDVINNQIGAYDIFVGIWWKRFGTPTKKADSGTKEEFDRAYKSWKDSHGKPRIMTYFNKENIPQKDFDIDQYKKVLEFKAEVSEKGVYYFEYNGKNEFEKIFRIQIRKCINDLFKRTEPVNTNEKPAISNEFIEFLNNTGINFSHRNSDNVSLDDIYIAPDLRDMENLKNRVSQVVVNLDRLIESINNGSARYALLGNENSGKTSVCKHLFKQYYKMGFLPVYLNGSELNVNIKHEKIAKTIEKKIVDQYQGPFNLSAANKEKIVLIIDDFHKSSKGKNKYWPALTSNIDKVVNNIIIAGNALMPIENINEDDAFKDFKFYAIMEFGPKFRKDLIDKWNRLGIDPEIANCNEILRKNDEYYSTIKTIIGKNYIPSYPFYLLSILQLIESNNTANNDYSVHGFYYELLINDCLNKSVKNPKEISFYYNYLAEFCYYLFSKQTKVISINEFEQFHLKYCEAIDVSYDFEIVLRTFSRARLLSIDDIVFVKDKYVYYFFTAKSISNKIGSDDVRNIVIKMCQRVFRDEYASIMMFLSHLSKDPFIIDELVNNANNIFKDIPVSRLDKDVSSINELIQTLPKQILAKIDVFEARKDEAQKEEDVEQLEKELEQEKSEYENFTINDDIAGIDFYAKLTLALKTIDILGQVAKKHWGSLSGQQKFLLVEAVYNLGFRTLNYYLNLIQRSSDDIAEHIMKLIQKDSERCKVIQDVKTISKNFIFRICYMSTFGIIKRIANAVGFSMLENTFEKVLNKYNYNSYRLTDFSVKLVTSNIEKHLDYIPQLKDDMKKNNLCMAVLQSLVVEYLYLFETTYRTKNKICNDVEISIEDQRIIDVTSTQKKE